MSEFFLESIEFVLKNNFLFDSEMFNPFLVNIPMLYPWAQNVLLHTYKSHQWLSRRN